KIGTVELTFDTGLDRHLRLSGHTVVMEKHQIRGAQPETIRDYTLELYNGSTLVKTEEVNDNFLRKVVHSFQGVTVNKVKITVKKSHGDENARLFEVRCYE